MPLWSNEQWRACIGSSWCAIGRPFKYIKTSSHQGKVLGYLQLVISAREIFLYGFLMAVIAIITGCNLLTSRCRKAIRGNLHHTTSFVKMLITVVLLLHAILAVQTSLLMRSGDVERNPGPGRYPDLDYSTVDNRTILDEDNFRDVFMEVHTLTEKYNQLGIVLGVPIQELNKIKKGYPQDLVQALTEMLQVWLRHSYGVDKYGPPTWQRLVEAVDDKAGGNNHALAKKIASNHPAELSVCGVSSPEIQKMTCVPQSTLLSSTPKRDSEVFEDIDVSNVTTRMTQSVIPTHMQKGPGLTLGAIGKSQSSDTFPPMAQRSCKGRTMSCVMEESNLGPEGEQSHKGRTMSYDNSHGSEAIMRSPFEKHRETMATYYKRQIDDRAWPPIKTTDFINLALIKDKSTWRKTPCGSIGKTVNEGDAASYHRIFEDIELKRFILLEGRPGSGKTTLMNNISRDWACRDILESFLLLLVPLRRLNNKEDRSIRTVLQVAYPGLSEHDLEQLAVHIEQHQGERVVFAFDGLDEYAPCFYDPITKLKEDLPYGTKKPLIRQLTSFFASNREQPIDDIFQIMYGKSLTKALVIVTSRPSASTKFREYAGKQIEVIGFLKAQITDYINHYFGNDEQKAKELMKHLEQHPNLMNMAYLPLHCAMLTFLYQEDTLLPNTETEFYKFFTISTLLRDMRKRHGTVDSLKSFDDLSVNDKAIFDKICRLAFTATAKSKQVFSADDVRSLSTYTNDDEGSLGLVVVDHCFTRYGLDDTYTFLHLTFQEYLAAVFVTGLTDAQQMEVIKVHRKDKHLSVVWKFLCGMINFSNPSAIAIFKSLLDTAAARDKLFQLQCCHESQSSLACRHVIGASNAQLTFKSTNFTPSDCTAIGYAIHEYEDEPIQLAFHGCNMSYEGAMALLQKIEDHPVSLTLKKGQAVNSILKALVDCTTPGLHCLMLSGNNISYKEAELLGKGLENCANIVKLDLSDNKIGADGAKKFADGLESCTDLQELDLSKNSLADEGIVALSTAIKAMENLQKLHLNKNEISNEGMDALSESIETLHALQQLSLNKNSIGDEGAIALSQAIEEMTCLKCLDLNYNYIGKDGQEAISAVTAQKEIKIRLNYQYSGL